MTLYFTITSPHQWVSLDNKGVQSSGVVDSLSDLDVKGRRSVAVVPGELVNTRTIELPIRNRKKLLAAIPYAIEDSLISQVDDLHFTILNVGTDNQVSFAYVNRDLMESWLEQIQLPGICLGAILPDYMLLPHATPDSAVITLSESGQALLRSGLYLGAATGQSNVPAWLEQLDKDVSLLADKNIIEQSPELQKKDLTVKEIGGRLVDWLSPGLPEHDAVLLSGEFEQNSQRSLIKHYWPAVAMIVLAGFIKLGSDVAELVWLQQTQTQIVKQTQELYQEFFPGSKLLAGRARVQTQNKLLSLQAVDGGSDFTYLLVTTSVLLRNRQVTFEEFDFRKGSLIAVMTLNDFAHLDRIKKRLQKDPSISVKLKQSGARGNKVQVRFEISRAMT